MILFTVSTRQGGCDMKAAASVPSGIAIQAAVPADYANILTPEAIEFLADLARSFEPTHERLLARRTERQKALDRGVRPDFLKETRSVREGDWVIAPFPAELADRRVEIT